MPRRPDLARRVTPALAIAVGVWACGPGELPPEGQLVLYVDTDAPLPRPLGEPADPAAPPPLFDRVRIDVYERYATAPCGRCTNEFDLNQERVSSGLASIGIAPEPGEIGLRARVRMFRGRAVRGGEPRPEATVETWVALPPVPEEGIVEATVFLGVNAVGVPIGNLDQPVAAEPGRPGASRVGSWPGAARTPCAGAPKPDEVCIPGGAFWMGNPRLSVFDNDEQRLVVLAPFFLDRTEATVGVYREGFAEVYGAGYVRLWSGVFGGDEVGNYCRYTPTPVGWEDLALNCVPWETASEYCAYGGKTLPTEAQLEYAMGGLRGTTFVWGNDEPTCADAVFGRGAFLYGDPLSACAPLAPIPGPLPSGSGARDVLRLEDGEVLDLAGNVSEHALDRYNGQDELCWGTGVLHNPVCAIASPVTGLARTTKGGSWLDPPYKMAAGVKSLVDHEQFRTPSVGVRCARSGR